MTAVASPLSSFQSNARWSSNGNTFGVLNTTDDITRMFNSTGPRKTVQRQNSSSSIASSTSSTSTVSATSVSTNGAVQPPVDAVNWANRKKPTRVLWPPGKAEPATGLSTARPQPISSITSGPTASSAISALHAPLSSSQQMTNGNAQTNGVVREQAPQAHQMPPLPPPPVLLHLVPMNGTFERKTITVPYAPEILRIGRQTNQKTIPTPINGYFDSKVLSRQHAEIYSDRQGRIFIRDVKSSNGTFVNGMRLSQENKESEPREIREGDMLELGIDIVSEDQKTVVHHKVAAKVEHAGIYGQSPDSFNFGELDPVSGPGLLPGSHMKRNGSQGSINPRMPLTSIVNQPPMNMPVLTQPQHMRNWLNPVTTEQVMKKLNAEMKLAMQQSQEIARARQAIETMLGGKLESPVKEPRSGSERLRPSPTKTRQDIKSAFSEPPAPPPQAPLPEKPDVARALADPVIQPLLRRGDTTRSPPTNGSPTRTDHSSDILRLCEELKLAKTELTSQNERMKTLEYQLDQERTARENAEERAQKLEENERKDSPTDEDHPSADGSADSRSEDASPDLQIQVDQLRTSIDEMKQQMEAYRQRAETAEAERDEVRQSLADMVEQKRIENAERAAEKSRASSRSRSKARRSPSKHAPQLPGKENSQPNGFAVAPAAPLSSPTSESLLERAGVEGGQPITQEQAEIITQYLAREVLGPHAKTTPHEIDKALLYYGVPYGSFAAVILLGYIAMTWVNGWPKIER